MLNCCAEVQRTGKVHYNELPTNQGITPLGEIVRLSVNQHKRKAMNTKCRMQECKRTLYSRNEQEDGICANCQRKINQSVKEIVEHHERRIQTSKENPPSRLDY